MAVNQQLKDYIDQQVKVGVSHDVIKTALLGAGWEERDINEAMAGLILPLGVEATKPVEMAKPVEIKPIGIKPTEAKRSDVDSLLSKLSTSVPAQEKTSPTSFVTSDIFQPKNESVFESKGITSQASLLTNKPQVSSVTGGTKNSFFRKPIVPIALGVLCIIFLVGAGILYAQNRSLQTKLNSTDQESTSLSTELDSLASDKSKLTGQITSLNQTVTDLNNQLSIFAMPVGTSTAELPIDVKGMLGGGGKSLYAVTTNKAIVVYVKNSKDAKVDAALKLLIGNQVEISGTHVAGSNSVTVTGINGRLLESSVQPTSTNSTKASTTVE